MGLFRFLLAISVLIAHSEPFFGSKLIPPNIAVEAFFIISGFYMSLIIEEKYSIIKNGYWLFLTNRFYRIFPLYWIVGIFSLIYAIAVLHYTKRGDNFALYVDNWGMLSPLSWCYIIISNIIILGQDLFLFLKITGLGNLQLTLHPFTSNPAVFRLLIVPPGWSLAIELYFYLICPLVIKMRNNPLIAFAMILILIRVIAWIYGYNFDPLLYRFFPFELPCFIAGILSYRLYRLILTKNIKSKWQYLASALLLTATLLYYDLPTGQLTGVAYLICVAVAAPFIFAMTKKSKIDRWIGDLSFPFYISHMIFVKFIKMCLSKYQFSDKYWSEMAFVLTFLFSVALIYSVGNKIERYRSMRIEKQIPLVI